MPQSCSGPGCAFRYTYLAATALGAGIAMAVIPGAKSIDPVSVAMFALLVGLSARELWTGPVSLWFRTLVGTLALAFVVGLVGTAVAERYLSGVVYTVVFVGIGLGGMWVAPRLVELSPIVSTDGGGTVG